MAKPTKPVRRKHVPQRTCVACRQVQGKREMVRIVRTSDAGVIIDPTGKRAGRGAYLHAARKCWEVALIQGRLAQALKAALTPEARERLQAYAQTLPESVDIEQETAPITVGVQPVTESADDHSAV